MKILFISMQSIHVTRWIENLKETTHELYWFDVMGRGKLNTIEEVHQFLNWKKRKIPYITGEYWLSKNMVALYDKIQPYLEVTSNEALERIIEEIQPHIVHSFEMQGCSYPVLKTMNKYPHIKWIYSCWGSDLFYYQPIKGHQKKINRVLARVNDIHTDCERDYVLAKEFGFKGNHLGVIPGGTGYRLETFEKLILPVDARKIILVKGYHHLFGRGLNIIKALELIQPLMEDYQVIVFGAHSKVIDYIEHHKLNFKVFSRHGLKQQELMELMGKSLLYIGNSISDGIPNTLLEAIVMGAFPIQSNPGDATQEIINDGVNGLLISNPDDIDEIKKLIKQAIGNLSMLKKAKEINCNISKERLNYEDNKKKVIEIYHQI